MARVRHTGLERLHVGVHRGRERQPRQVRQMVGAERRPEALLAQQPELSPRRSTGIVLEDEVPLLGCAGEVVGRQPDSVSMACLLAIEELFTFIQPAERVFFAVVGGEREFMEAGDGRACWLGRYVRQRGCKVHGCSGHGCGWRWKRSTLHD